MLYLKSNLLDNFFGDLDSYNYNSGAGSYSPKTDIIENENNYELHLEVPGFKEEELKIEVKDGYLVINGKNKVEKKEQDDKKYLYKERHSSEVERYFRLPKDADKEKISAKLEDGILNLFVEKKEEEKPKLIRIN